MPILFEFDYVRPKTLAEAVKVLAKNKSAIALIWDRNFKQIKSKRTKIIFFAVIYSLKSIAYSSFFSMNSSICLCNDSAFSSSMLEIILILNRISPN